MVNAWNHGKARHEHRAVAFAATQAGSAVENLSPCIAETNIIMEVSVCIQHEWKELIEQVVVLDSEMTC